MGEYGTTRWKFSMPAQITKCLGEIVVLTDSVLLSAILIMVSPGLGGGAMPT